jgi:hypothetical protein
MEFKKKTKGTPQKWGAFFDGLNYKIKRYLGMDKIKNLTLGEFHSRINKAGYVASEELSANVFATLYNKPMAGAFLFGYSGSGKTFLPEVIARVAGMKQVFYQCFPNTREEDLMTKLLPSEDTPSGIKIADGPLVQAIETSKEEPVLLIIDEWDKTRSSSDSFLLSFLQTGRVHYNGDVHEANTDNLFVYITMNDERELSEPLQRRMPRIEFEMLEPRTVAKALSMTHKEHPMLSACIKLYQYAYSTTLNKPVTIQELRQLMDASDALQGHADWDSLVFQYVTKGNSNHSAIASSLNMELPDINEHVTEKRREKISTEYFGNLEYDIDFASNKYHDKEVTPNLPETSAIKIKLGNSKIVNVSPKNPDKVTSENCYGVFPFTQESYDLLQTIYQHSDDSGKILDSNGDDFAVVKDDLIYIVRPLRPEDAIILSYWLDKIDHQGEITINTKMLKSEAMGIFKNVFYSDEVQYVYPVFAKKDNKQAVINYIGEQDNDSHIDVLIESRDGYKDAVAHVELVGSASDIRGLVDSFAQLGAQAIGFKFAKYGSKLVDVRALKKRFGDTSYGDNCIPEDVANTALAYKAHHSGAMHRHKTPKLPLYIFVTDPASRGLYYNIRRSKEIVFNTHEKEKETYIAENSAIVYSDADSPCVMAVYGEVSPYIEKQICKITGEKTFKKAIQNHTKSIWTCYASVTLSENVNGLASGGFYNAFGRLLKKVCGQITHKRMSLTFNQNQFDNKGIIEIVEKTSLDAIATFRFREIHLKDRDKLMEVNKRTNYDYSIEYLFEFVDGSDSTLWNDALQVGRMIQENILEA